MLNTVQKHVVARFSAAAPTYDEQQGVQQAVAENVLQMITQTNCISTTGVPRILEVGCGTGNLTALLSGAYPTSRILAVDVAETMIKAAQSRLGHASNVFYRSGDIHRLTLPTSCDLITSSSALHWVNPLAPLLQRLEKALNPGGALICAMMGHGTLKELHALRQEIAPTKSRPVALPERESVFTAAKRTGLHIDRLVEEQMVARYASGREFIRTLNRQGVTGGFYDSANVLNRYELRRLVEEYDRRYSLAEGGVCATYDVIYLSCKSRKQSK